MNKTFKTTLAVLFYGISFAAAANATAEEEAIEIDRDSMEVLSVAKYQ